MEKNDVLQAAAQHAAAGSRTRRRRAVILDAGDHAWLETAEPTMTIGSRFSRRGMQWEITGFRQHVNAYVAEPVVQ